MQSSISQDLSDFIDKIRSKFQDSIVFFGFVKKYGTTWKPILPIRNGEIIFLGGSNQVYLYKEEQPVTITISNLNEYAIYFAIYADNGSGNFKKIYPPNYTLQKIEANTTNVPEISALQELPTTIPYMTLTLGTTFTDSSKKTLLPNIHSFKLYITITDQFTEDRPYLVFTRKIEVYSKNHPLLPFLFDETN